jgi:hypothetical protein
MIGLDYTAHAELALHLSLQGCLMCFPLEAAVSRRPRDPSYYVQQIYASVS